MVAPRQDQFYAIEMIEGATTEARKHGVDIAVLEGATTDDTSQQITDAMDALLTERPEIDGVIAKLGT